ncbi:hypothetical protein [Sorangium sp. So ce854]|uniref:hypothetical protein n=1 Tax=Sorangium sp. So ce854 TaxID=3133322 RepID=UPI003F63EC76
MRAELQLRGWRRHGGWRAASDAGWEVDRAGGGGWGTPGQGGGGGSEGGHGGHGGPGRGGDSIGVAPLDEDRLTALDVTFTLGPPGKDGIRRDEEGKMISGEDGVAVEVRPVC